MENFYSLVLLLSLKLKISRLLQAHGFSRRGPSLPDLLNYTDNFTEEQPPGEMIDGSVLANGGSQSC